MRAMITIRHNCHVGLPLRLIAWRKCSRAARRSAVPVDALPSTDNLRPGQGGSGTRRRASGPVSPFPSAQAARTIEDHDQLVARRRAAQQAWRHARERAERAAQHLSKALNAPLSPAANTARERMEHAQRGERRARIWYYRVAKETGALLTGLERAGAGTG